MKYVIILLSFIFLLKVSASPLNAQISFPTISPTITPNIEYALPYAGILPDHPLFFFKQIRDRILILFTRQPLKKSQLYLVLSDKSLVMGGLLWEKGNYNLSTVTLNDGEKYLLQSVMVLFDVTNKDQDIPPGMADKLELAAKKHEEAIINTIEKTQESSQKQNLDQALSITHQAIQKISTLKSL